MINILKDFAKRVSAAFTGCGNCGKNHKKTEHSARLAMFLSGPSGVGKTTIENQLLMTYKSRWFKAKSTTTRAPRGNAFEDDLYEFISAKKFASLVKRRGFFFHMKSNYKNGVCYGFTNSEIKRGIKSGRVIVLSAHASSMDFMRKKLSDTGVKSVSIFLMPPSIRELKRRIENRGTENKTEVARRLANAQAELAFAKIYDHRIVSENPVDVVKQINDIVCRAIDDAGACKINKDKSPQKKSHVKNTRKSK